MHAIVHVFVATLACFAAVVAVSNGSDASSRPRRRVLALVDDLNVEKTHSRFFQFLRDNGFNIDIKDAGEAGLRLHRYGELEYSHLILFAPKATRFGGDITTENIVKFVDMGGNVLVAAGVGVTGDLLRNLALEFGFELDESGTAVIDHFHYDKTDADGPHTLIAVGPANLIRTKEVVGSDIAQAPSPFLYRGIALRVDDVNQLAFPVMHASSQAYSYKPGKQITTFPFSIGRSTVLIGSMQARNNARVTFCGSLEFFSDALFGASVDSALFSAEKKSAAAVKSGNEPLAQALALWTFKEVGVLRIVEVHHYKVEKSAVGQKSGVKSTTAGVEQPSEYTVMEDVHYRVRLEEYKRSGSSAGEWVPYQGNDVQLEFVRIDPFIRTTLKPEGRAYLGTQFTVPDVYGVFTFRIDHKRQGLTYVESRVQIPVRPLLHTQYERFIYSAYPYYASAFSMMIGVLLLSLVFVGLREDGAGENRRATTAATGSVTERYSGSVDAVPNYSAPSSPAGSVSTR